MYLKINPELKALIPPLSAEEFEQLEKNILEEGIRDSIITWEGFIIDGHNRYEIATKHALLFDSKELDFESKQEVKVWMIKNQFGRRNLPAYERAKLALELKGIFAAQAKETQGQRNDLWPKSARSNEGLETAKELGKLAGIGKNLIKQVAKIEEKATPEMKEQIKAGSLSINQAYQTVRAEEQRNKAEERIQEKTKKELTEEESEILEKAKRGETVVININKHFHVLKWAKENNTFKRVDRFSEFGNPFYLDIDGDRLHVCESYGRYLKDKKGLHDKVKALKGHVLGCHCAPLMCHGDILKTWADGE